MGMPGSETALEKLMFRVLGSCIQDGIVTKLADDLYCGGNTLDELLSNWKRVLESLQKSNLKLSPSKTVICPRSTIILGWIWTQGVLSGSPHRVAVLAKFPPPDTVRGLRSFIGALIGTLTLYLYRDRSKIFLETSLLILSLLIYLDYFITD